MLVRDPLLSFAVLSFIARGGHKRRMGFYNLLFFCHSSTLLCVVALKLRSLHIHPLVCVASQHFNTNQHCVTLSPSQTKADSASPLFRTDESSPFPSPAFAFRYHRHMPV